MCCAKTIVTAKKPDRAFNYVCAKTDLIMGAKKTVAANNCAKIRLLMTAKQRYHDINILCFFKDTYLWLRKTYASMR